MPSQKKSGNRGSQRESPISKKNDSFFDAYLSDLRKDGAVEDVYVARVLRKYGNGRMELLYVNDGVASIVNAHIRGLFRGKGKHSVNIDVGAIVLVVDTGMPGGTQYEIDCLLSPDQIYALRKATVLDARILAVETDEAELMKGEKIDMGGFDIVGGGDSDDDEQGVEAEVDIDRI